MKERMMRITAGCAALLLILVYVFFPVRDIVIRAGNGGRTKLELQEGEKVSWAWSPEITGKTMLRIRLSGMKNAQNVTLHAELTEENGDVVSTAAISGSELEKDAGKSIQLEGIFQKERKYLLTMWTDGGTLKVRGAEEAETGFFYPAVTETFYTETRNPVLLYFACGAFMIAMTPIWGVASAATVRFSRRERDIWNQLLPWGTFALLMTLGLLLVLVKPPLVGWYGDEGIHEENVAAMSLLDAGSIQNLAASLITWNPAYIPPAIGYNLGRLVTTRLGVLYRMASIFNTFAYSILCALAVAHAPRYKATFFVVSTMPKMVFFMVSPTYDMVVIGSILLGISLTLESIYQEERISSARGILMVSLLAFGTVAKPAYSLVLLILLMIPANLLGGKGKAWIFRSFVLLMLFWCAMAVLMPGAYDNVISGDSRFNGHISTSEQIQNMLENPIESGMKPIRFVWKNSVTLMKMGIADWQFLGTYEVMNDIWLWILLVAAPLCTTGEAWEKRDLLTAGRRIGLGCIAVGAEVLLAYAQYLASSEVGGALRGLQARYFVPVWIAMALALMWPQEIRKVMRKAEKWMTAGVFLACLAGNWWNAIMHLIEEGLI